jgi:hypothetical protein
MIKEPLMIRITNTSWFGLEGSGECIVKTLAKVELANG